MADGTRNMTVGSPAGHLIRFALPLLAGSFLQQLYNMVDSFVVGRYVGDAALAAVGVAFRSCLCLPRSSPALPTAAPW